MKLFDSHAHYNDERFDQDRDAIISEAHEEGVAKILNVGYSLESSKKAVEIANNYDFMYASCRVVS